MDGYGSSDKRHVLSVSMAACGEERVLRDHYVMLDRNLVLIMDPHALADPGPISNRELPGKCHAGTGTEYNSATDLGAERSQNRNAKV